MEPLEAPRRSTRVARTAFASGLLSLLLLGAAFLLAHDWNPATMALVGAWGGSTVVSVVTSIWGALQRAAPNGLLRGALAFSLVSLVALALAGLVFAAGDVPNACGGG